MLLGLQESEVMLMLVLKIILIDGEYAGYKLQTFFLYFSIIQRSRKLLSEILSKSYERAMSSIFIHK